MRWNFAMSTVHACVPGGAKATWEENGYENRLGRHMVCASEREEGKVCPFEGRVCTLCVWGHGDRWGSHTLSMVMPEGVGPLDQREERGMCPESREREKRTYHFRDTCSRIETGREVRDFYKRVDRLNVLARLREMAADTDLVWFSRSLRLDGNDERGGLEGPPED